MSQAAQLEEADYEAWIQELAQQCMDREFEYLIKKADEHGVDLSYFVEVVEALEAARPAVSADDWLQRQRDQHKTLVRQAAARASGHGSDFLDPGHLRPGMGGYDDTTNPQDAAAQLEAMDWSKKLSPEELVALDEYTVGGFHQVNTSLRTGASMSEEDQQTVQLLDAALAKAEPLKEPIVVYRGIRLESAQTAKEWTQQHFEVGDEWEFPSYLSTSWDPAIGANFAKDDERSGVVFEIKTRRGAPLNEVSSFGGHERERLLPRGMVFRVAGLHHGVAFESRFRGTRERTVVQLEEVFEEEL